MRSSTYKKQENFDPPVLFRQKEDLVDTEERIDIEEEFNDDEGDSEGNVICRSCYNLLTKSSNKINIDGSHRHVFANPHGHVFEIGCFRHVTGCGYTGVTTGEFSWFKGYSWRIAICASCFIHLGWLFTASDKEIFHGLILKQIVESRSSSPNLK